MALLRRKDIFCFASVWLLYALLVGRHWFVVDDAYISFRYARNFAQGFGLRYNIAQEVPVEGYSNFLWVLICGVVEYFGADPGFCMPLISFIAGSILLYMLYHLLLVELQMTKEVVFSAVLMLAAFPPFAVWSTSGLETMLYTLLLFLTFYYLHCCTGRWALAAAAVSALALSLCRPEGFLWAAFIVFARAARNIYRRQGLRELALPALILIAGISLHVAWRYSYYGELVPNTVHAKAGLTAATLTRGFRYLMEFYLTFPVQFLILAASCFILIPGYGSLTATASGVVIATYAWTVFVGGDFMAFGRFFIPALPFQCLIIAIALQRLRQRVPRASTVAFAAVALTLIGLLPSWNVHVVPRALLQAFHFRHNSKSFRTEFEQWGFMQENFELWKNLGKELGKISSPGDSLVSGAIGAVGYFSNIYIYDRFGLVNAQVSKRPVSKSLHSPGHDSRVPASFFRDKEPTFLDASYHHGDKIYKSALKLGEAWKKSARYEGYTPEIHFVNGVGGTKAALVLLRRIEDGEDRGVLWNRYLASLQAVSNGI